MPQIYHRSFNTLSKVSIFGGVFIIAFLGWCLTVWSRSSYATNVGLARVQPVQFSHEHHVRGLGIDCRYCHTSVEDSSFAGIPATKTCMNCHSQIWVGSPYLEPVRESYRSGKSIPWERIHRLGDFAYFNHSIHVQKGIGCSTCHGPVQRMPLTYQHATLLMEWCLDCHRHPEKFVRPRDKVFEMEWPPPGWNQKEKGRELVEKHNIRSLLHCSTCHR